MPSATNSTPRKTPGVVTVKPNRPRPPGIPDTPVTNRVSNSAHAGGYVVKDASGEPTVTILPTGLARPPAGAESVPPAVWQAHEAMVVQHYLERTKTRGVRFAEDFPLGTIRFVDADGCPITVEWGEVDEYGFYEPVFTVHHDFGKHRPDAEPAPPITERGRW